MNISLKMLVFQGRSVYSFVSRHLINEYVKPKNAGFSGLSVILILVVFFQTYAELDKSEKNKISHRSLALQKLKDFLLTQ